MISTLAGIGDSRPARMRSKGGFAAAAGADEDEGVDAREIEGDIIEDAMGAEGFGDAG
jgi:hypothetical protein